MELLVYFKYKNTEKPFIKVLNGKNQAVLAFLPFDGEHITIHKQKDGSILRTHHDKNKLKSYWDYMRIEIARKLCYKNPDRHGEYIIHDRPMNLINMDGYHLVGRRFDISQAVKEKEKYKKMEKVVIEIPQENIMANFYLSTADNPYTKENPSFPTSLGEIFVESEDNKI